MINLFRAEWQKLVGHRWAVGALVWIFPAGAIGILLLMTLIALLAPADVQQNFGLAAVDGGARWTDAVRVAWALPNQVFGRFLIQAFAAVMFAGEYQWGTWKNLLPRRRRIPLIANKFVTLGAFMVVSFGVMSLIVAFGYWLPVTLAGGAYGPPLGEALADGFVREMLIQVGVMFTSTAIAVGYAALAAMITRSILGGVLVGMGLLVLEVMSQGVIALLSFLFNNPEIMALFRWTPRYNIANIVTILKHEPTLFGFLDDLGAANSAELSLLVLAVWVFGLLGLTLVLFQRQDVTT